MNDFILTTMVADWLWLASLVEFVPLSADGSSIPAGKWESLVLAYLFISISYWFLCCVIFFSFSFLILSLGFLGASVMLHYFNINSSLHFELRGEETVRESCLRCSCFSIHLFLFFCLCLWMSQFFYLESGLMMQLLSALSFLQPLRCWRTLPAEIHGKFICCISFSRKGKGLMGARIETVQTHDVINFFFFGFEKWGMHLCFLFTKLLDHNWRLHQSAQIKWRRIHTYTAYLWNYFYLHGFSSDFLLCRTTWRSLPWLHTCFNVILFGSSFRPKQFVTCNWLIIISPL